MIIKFILGCLVFITIVSLVGAIYLGWEKTDERNKNR